MKIYNWLIRAYDKFDTLILWRLWNLKQYKAHREAIRLQIIASIPYIGLILGIKKFGYRKDKLKHWKYLLYKELLGANEPLLSYSIKGIDKETVKKTINVNLLYRYDIIFPLVKLKFYEENIDFKNSDIQKISIEIAEMMPRIETAIVNHKINEFIDSI